MNVPLTPEAWGDYEFYGTMIAGIPLSPEIRTYLGQKLLGSVEARNNLNQVGRIAFAAGALLDPTTGALNREEVENENIQ